MRDLEIKAALEAAGFAGVRDGAAGGGGRGQAVTGAAGGGGAGGGGGPIELQGRYSVY